MIDKFKQMNKEDDYIDEDYFYNQYIKNKEEISKGEEYINNTLAYRYDEILL